MCVISTVLIALFAAFAAGCANSATHDQVWAAICMVESGGDARAHNEAEDARGIAQIRSIMVRDVNRILGRQAYTHDDAYDPVKAREMFDIYNKHYHPLAGPEQIARCWNGGPQGHTRPATQAYWEKVRQQL